jgi:predicted Zn-dependent peptidase
MVNRSVLKNGIRVISQRVPHACSVTIGIWVVGGSRQEQESSSGISHFIEHLLFKGTDSRSSLEIAREIDSMGGFMNAFTGREFVCYYTKVLAEFFPKALDLLADIFLNSRFPEEEIESERRVILQEIRMLEDNPEDQLHNLFHREFWLDHPMGMPIIGSAESINGMSREVLARYKKDNYLAGNIIISAAGQLDHHELVETLSVYFDMLPDGSCGNKSPVPVYSRRFASCERNLEQLLFAIGTQGLPQNHPGRYDAMMLNTILGGSMSSRLFQEVREKDGLAYSIYSYLESHSDTGAFVVAGGTTADKFDKVMDIVAREIKKLKSEPLSEEQLASARQQLKGNILLSLESGDNIMSKLAKNEIYLGGYQSIDQVMAGFSAVTGESVLDLCNELFDQNKITTQLLGKLPDSMHFMENISL